MTATLQQLVIDDKGEAGWEPHFHPGQQKAWDSRARFVSVTAGSQSGKTCFGPWWLLREVTRRGKGDYGVVTATYPLLTQKVLPEMRGLFERVLGWEYRGGDSPRSAATLTRADGSRIFLSSAQTPQESGTWKAAWEDECGLKEFGLETHRGIERRVQLAQGRILFSTTPYHWGWHKTEVVDRADGDSPTYDPLYENINFRSCDNPAYPMAEYLRLKAELPDWYSAMFLDGLYTRPAGQIHRDFDEAVHVVRPFQIPPTWRRAVGIDFGPVNTCVIWAAEDPESRDSEGNANWFAYREAHGGGKDSAQHAREARRYRENVARWVGGAPSEDDQREEWFDAALIRVERPPIAEVETQINCVNKWLRLRRFYVFATCRGLIGDLKRFSRELDAAGQPTDKIEAEADFHHEAGTRYLISSLDKQPLQLPTDQRPGDPGPYTGGVAVDESADFA